VHAITLRRTADWMAGPTLKQRARRGRHLAGGDWIYWHKVADHDPLGRVDAATRAVTSQ
jgi:hypothetical protein